VYLKTPSKANIPAYFSGTPITKNEVVCVNVTLLFFFIADAQDK
jgi:hypothetical protein